MSLVDYRALEEFNRRWQAFLNKQEEIKAERDVIINKIIEYAMKNPAFDFSSRYYYYCDGHVYFTLCKQLRFKYGEPVLNKPWYMTIYIRKEDLNTIYVNFKNYNDKTMNICEKGSLPLKINLQTEEIYNIIDNIHEYYNSYFYEIK